MKISELRSPYRELAELRTTNEGAIDLKNAFEWGETHEGVIFWLAVNRLQRPKIPAESLKELQPEWVVGEEYEFSDCGRNWFKRELVAILPEKYESRFMVQSQLVDNECFRYEQIRHIQPQVNELTLEEIADKFGVSVETIKIKK